MPPASRPGPPGGWRPGKEPRSRDTEGFCSRASRGCGSVSTFPDAGVAVEKLWGSCAPSKRTPGFPGSHFSGRWPETKPDFRALQGRWGREGRRDPRGLLRTRAAGPTAALRAPRGASAGAQRPLTLPSRDLPLRSPPCLHTLRAQHLPPHPPSPAPPQDSGLCLGFWLEAHVQSMWARLPSGPWGCTPRPARAPFDTAIPV